MKIIRTWAAWVIVIALVLGACTPATPTPAPVVEEPTEAVTQAPVADPTAGTDPQNATYIIEGQPVTLVNGTAETELAPGSASTQVTKYFWNEVQLDLNGDGLTDTALLLTLDGGGSGTFFYVAAALNTGTGSLGTNAILLGDRIAPQSTNVDPNKPVQFIVNYADRKASEPMSSPPTVGVSRAFKVENNTMVEVGTPPTQTP